MTTILQMNEDDLLAAIKRWSRESFEESKSIQESSPPQDRIDKEVVKQMTGQSDSWIYKKTMPKCKDPLPHEKFGKRLVFSRKLIQEYIDSHTKSTHISDMIMTERLARIAKKRL